MVVGGGGDQEGGALSEQTTTSARAARSSSEAAGNKAAHPSRPGKAISQPAGGPASLEQNCEIILKLFWGVGGGWGSRRSRRRGWVRVERAADKRLLSGAGNAGNLLTAGEDSF